MIAPHPGVAAWHDVECAGYEADLPLWRDLADSAEGEVLELGCGTGRVALDLAARGIRVTGIDHNSELVGELRARARNRNLALEAHALDARSFELGSRFALAIAPMQVVQVLGGPAERASLIECVRRHLGQGGLFAAAVADPFEGFDPGDARPPRPDVRERDGWRLSSLPVALRHEPGGVAIDRHRQAVSPEGRVSERVCTIHLDSLDAVTLASEGEAAGFTVLEPRRVPATSDHVGSTVVMMEAPA